MARPSPSPQPSKPIHPAARALPPCAIPAEPLIGDNSEAPAPYNTSAVASVVRWGAAPDALTEQTEQDHRLTYDYVYGAEAGDTTYQSPILHHVLLRGLTTGQPYFYQVGDPEQLNGWSPTLNFTLPAAYPLRIGVVGDLG